MLAARGLSIASARVGLQKRKEPHEWTAEEKEEHKGIEEKQERKGWIASGSILAVAAG